MIPRLLPERAIVLSWLLSVALLCWPPLPGDAFTASPWTPREDKTVYFNRLRSSFAFHDEPSKSSPEPVGDFSGIRDAIRVGQVLDAFQDVSRLRSIGDPIPQELYEDLLLRCADGRRPPWLQVGREAMELYLVDVSETGLTPSARVMRNLLVATSKAGDVNGSLILLRLMATYQPQVLTEYHFFLALDCCARSRRMSFAEAVLKQMDDLRIPRTVYIYSVLLKGYGRQKWAREVEATVQELLTRKEANGMVLKPDVVLMNTVVDAFVKCGDPKRARQLLSDMAQCTDGSLPAPDLYTYNTVIKGLSDLGDMNAVMDLYRGMQRLDVQPDSITINTLVGAAVSTGNLIKAKQLLQDSSVPASVEGYTALLEGFVRRCDFEKANDVLKDMKALGVSPNVQTYTSLLKGASLSGDLDQMMDIFQAMAVQGEKDPMVRPNVWTYNTVISCLIQGGRLEGALRVWEEMKHQHQQRIAADPSCASLRPDVVTMNTLLDGLLNEDPPRVRDAEALFMEMMETGTQPDEYTFSILLNAYEPELTASSQQQGKASLLGAGPTRLLDMVMRNGDVNLDTTAVNTLLFALVRGGEWKKLIAFFDGFKAGELTRGRPGRPDVITYTILIGGVAESSNMYAGAKIMQLYREMRQQYKLRPDRRIINAIVNSVARARSRLGGLEMEDLEEVFEDLRRLGWSDKQIEALEQQSWSYAGLYSEAWKDQRGRGGGGKKRRGQQQPPDDALFQKHGWNVIDSGFGLF